MKKNFFVKMDKQDKFWFIVKIIFGLFALVFLVLLVFGANIFGEDSLYYNSVNIFTGKGGNIWLTTLSYCVIILSSSYVIRLILSLICKTLKKGKALLNMICSFIKYIGVLILIFALLSLWGVNTTALLAGAGILSLVVGLGAQPLIEDIIAGLFIVFENVYDVGDIIFVDNFRGTVKEIGIRTTKIIDAGGNVKTINNSDIRTIINMTNEMSLAMCDVSIEYGESLERVENVIKDNLELIRENIPAITDGPYYKGVTKLDSSGVVLRFLAECPETEKYQTERDLNREIKLMFDRNKINIPFTQVVIHQPSEFTKANKEQIKRAEEFVSEQRESSKGIGEMEEK